MPSIDQLDADEVRDALALLGLDDPGSTHTARRLLREQLIAPGMVADLVSRAEDVTAEVFRTVAIDGAASVEDLIGRGWAGRGRLPAPLDWLQRRALVIVGDEGLVHATDEARHGYATLTFDLPPAEDVDVDALEEPPPEPTAPLLIEEARTVVIAPTQAALDRAAAVPGAALRTVADTVAISSRPPLVVQSALESAGAEVSAAHGITVSEREMTLPGAEEEAVGPRAIRQLVSRALQEQRQLRLEYFASSRGGQATERVVDPWAFEDDLLRGYCHLRSAERAFAVDRIGRARLLATAVSHRPE
ncbi:WYL domain-containing protein [Euzebya tangerina]|uniref:WYL domain-containing protein n=1 Tax=Euzebya tangerina TaxID=591198 RepID=UPI000E310B71|nr:WYL domain-containing protein [Euzebya tangerina]